MSDALVQSATIQLKAQAGGGFGSVPDGGNGLTFHTISGSGFGAGPEVLLFDRFNEGVAGESIALDSPYIGSWLNYNGTPAPTYFEEAGRLWATSREISKLNDNTISRTSLEWRAGQELTEFRFSFRLVCPSGYRFVGAANTNDANNIASNHKYAWFGRHQEGNAQGATGGQPDIVLPTNSGAGNTMQFSGNNVQPKYYDIDPINGDDFYTGRDGVEENLYSFYQKPETGSGLKDGKIENSLHSGSGLGVTVRDQCTIWQGPQGPITTESYNMFIMNGFMGNAGANGYQNCMPLVADIYCATGPNSRARIILSDQPTLASSTKMYEVPHAGWSDTEVNYYSAPYEELGFKHLELADGTFLENV